LFLHEIQKKKKPYFFFCIDQYPLESLSSMLLPVPREGEKAVGKT
jgi:hypothetical protein